MKRIVLSCLASVALLAGLGRADTPELITHEVTELKSAAVVRVAGSIKIVLPDKGEPDHVWQIISNDPRILKPLGDVKRSAAPKAAGALGPWEITLVAQRPGRIVTRFVYTKPGGDDVLKPDDIRDVTVTVR
jgi:hypothetical protein